MNTGDIVEFDGRLGIVVKPGIELTLLEGVTGIQVIRHIDDCTLHKYPKVTGKQACEFIVDTIKTRYPEFTKTPKEIWNLSIVGELYPIMMLYTWAYDYKNGWVPFESIPYEIV